MRVALPFIGELDIKRVRPHEDVDRTAELGIMVSDAQEALRKRHLDWKQFDEYYMGIQDINKDIDLTAEGNKDKKPINFCMSTIETMVPILRDASPMWYALYEGEAEVGAELARDVTSYLQGFWHHAELDHTLEEIYRDMLIYGTGVAKAYWDGEANVQQREEEEEVASAFEGEVPTLETVVKEEPIGEVAVEWCDPYSVFPDPNARKFKECRYVAIKVEISKEDLKRQFPDIDEDELTSVGGLQTERMRPDEQMHQRAELIEVWEVYDDFGADLTIYSGSQILWEGPNPTPGKRFPVIFFTNRRRGGWLWGKSEIGELINVQDNLNLVNWRIMVHQRFTLYPGGTTNIKDLKGKTNRPGETLYVPPKAGSGIAGYYEERKIEGLPPTALNILTWIKQSFDVLSGVHDVMEGRRPAGITSGIALAQLAEAAQGRLRLMIASMAISLQELGQLVLEWMQDSYVEDRQLSFFGEEKPETVGLRAGQLADVMGSGMRVPLRVVVQSRGDLPLNPAAQLDIALRMYELGLIDREEVLRIARWPGRDKVIERIKAAEQAMMQGQLEAMMGQQGGMGETPGAGMPEEMPMGMEAMG